MTIEKFVKLPKDEQDQLIAADDKTYIVQLVHESAQQIGLVPRTKATVGFRVGSGPFVVHFRKHGRWYKWGYGATGGPRRERRAGART